MKPYISIAEQISLLESRNIIITNYNFAHRVLEYENYYCVINACEATDNKASDHFVQVHEMVTILKMRIIRIMS